MDPAIGSARRMALDHRPTGIAGRVRAWIRRPPTYPATAADLRTIDVLGVPLPIRATLVLLVVSLVTLLDHAGVFLGWFWSGGGPEPALLRARAISRGAVFGLGSLALIVLVLRDRPSRYGARLGEARAGIAIAGLGCLVMAPIVLAAAQLPSFREYYVAASATSPWDVFLTSGIEVIPAEFFFRGLLMFTLLRSIGPMGIVVAQLPFAFAHIGKPEVETISTLFGGLAYGWLDWRTGSVLWSGLAHTIILSMAVLVSGAVAPG
jgi:membrane protease YdiL (CAAX protease family)